MKTNIKCLGIFVLFLAVINTTSAQTPHGWRGPDHNGLYYETGLLKTWPTEGPELLWETMDIGKRNFCPINVML